MYLAIVFRPIFIINFIYYFFHPRTIFDLSICYHQARDLAQKRRCVCSISPLSLFSSHEFSCTRLWRSENSFLPRFDHWSPWTTSYGILTYQDWHPRPDNQIANPDTSTRTLRSVSTRHDQHSPLERPVPATESELRHLLPLSVDLRSEVWLNITRNDRWQRYVVAMKKIDLVYLHCYVLFCWTVRLSNVLWM